MDETTPAFAAMHLWSFILLLLNFRVKQVEVTLVSMTTQQHHEPLPNLINTMSGSVWCHFSIFLPIRDRWDLQISHHSTPLHWWSQSWMKLSQEISLNEVISQNSTMPLLFKSPKTSILLRRNSSPGGSIQVVTCLWQTTPFQKYRWPDPKLENLL